MAESDRWRKYPDPEAPLGLPKLLLMLDTLLQLVLHAVKGVEQSPGLSIKS